MDSSLLVRIAFLLLTGFTLSGCSPTRAPIYRGYDEIETGAIIGGEPVLATDAIYRTTVLVVDLHNGDTCTGSILSARWIVTAAHCAEGKVAKDFIVGFGVSDREVIAHPTAQNRRSVGRVIVHPRFAEVASQIREMQKAAEARGRDIDFAELDKIRDWFDVAILELSSDIPADHQAIALAPSGTEFQKGELLTVAGYGRSVAQKPLSAGLLLKTQLPVEAPVWGISELLLDQHAGRAVCNGDSGGPVIADRSGRPMLVGVTSRGVGDNLENNQSFCAHSTAITSLVYFREWLREQTGI